MASMVEENGNTNLRPLNDTNTSNNNNNNNLVTNNNNAMSSNISTSAGSATTQTASPSAAPQFIHNLTPSVIQPNQSSVIQTAPLPHKGNVLYLSNPNSKQTVIQTPGAIPIQIKNEHQNDTNSDDSITDEDSPNVRRRPSYNQILNDISGPDQGQALQLQDGGISNLPGSIIGNTSTILLSQDSSHHAFYNMPKNSNYSADNSQIAQEDQSRKREIRLQKNREAARECRRKKKEYIKCLENRVAVLENQNKALIEELKTLKELYCAQKND